MDLRYTVKSAQQYKWTPTSLFQEENGIKFAVSDF